MKRSTIIVIIVFAVLVVGGVLLYFLYERPQQQKAEEFVNLSIFAKEDNNLVKTGYKLYVNGGLFSKGNTSKISATFEKIPRNSTALIFNENLEGQNYYIIPYNFETYYSPDIFRINLNLEKGGELEIKQSGIFGLSDIVILNLTSDGLFKNWIVCFDWGTHFIYVQALDLISVDRIENNVRCFSGIDLEDKEKLDIHLDYKVFGQLDTNDYVNITFYEVVDKPYTLKKEFLLRQYFEV